MGDEEWKSSSTVERLHRILSDYSFSGILQHITLHVEASIYQVLRPILHVDNLFLAKPQLRESWALRLEQLSHYLSRTEHAES